MSETLICVWKVPETIISPQVLKNHPAQRLKDFNVNKKDRHNIQTHFNALPLLQEVYELQVCILLYPFYFKFLLLFTEIFKNYVLYQFLAISTESNFETIYYLEYSVLPKI